MTPPSRVMPASGRRTANPRIRQRRELMPLDVGRKRFRVVISVVVVVLLVIGAAALLHTSLFTVRVVTVTGTHPHTSTAAIVSAAGLVDRPLMINVNPVGAVASVMALPFIAGAEVIRHWPDGVEVAVSERVPVAVMAGPGGAWAEVDGSGRILEVAPTRPGGLVQLVATSANGANVDTGQGRVLPGEAKPGLLVCRTLPLAFSAQVISVTVAADKTVKLALNSGLTVILGTATNLTVKYVDVASIIAHGSLVGKKIIDVSVPAAPTFS